MSTQEIVEVVGELVVDDGKTLEQQHGPKALAVAQEMQTALVPYVAENPTYAPLWEQFCAAPQEQAPALTGILQVILSADTALAQRLDALLVQYQQAKGTSASTTINTGGGAYVGGDVTLDGGDFVGRDRITVTGDGNVIGDGSSATVIKQTADPDAIAKAFKQFYDAVDTRPDTSAVDKEDLETDLQEMEQEVTKGDEANEGFLMRRLRNIKRMAPDVWDVVLATFANPLAGLGMVAKKVAQKAKAEADE